MAVSTVTIVLGDGNSLREAEWMVVSEEAEELLEVLADASAYSSAGEDLISKGEEGCCVVVAGASLMVTCSESAHFASDYSVCCKSSHPCGTCIACSTGHAQAAHPDCVCMQYIISSAATLWVRIF